jgi:hypothetical protein
VYGERLRRAPLHHPKRGAASGYGLSFLIARCGALGLNDVVPFTLSGTFSFLSSRLRSMRVSMACPLSRRTTAAGGGGSGGSTHGSLVASYNPVAKYTAAGEQVSTASRVSSAARYGAGRPSTKRQRRMTHAGRGATHLLATLPRCLACRTRSRCPRAAARTCRRIAMTDKGA